MFVRAAVVIVAFVVAIQAQTNPLDRFLNKDLWKDRPSKNDQRYLIGLVGSVPKGFALAPEPWHVWKVGRNQQERYVVLLGEDALTIPGGSSACVQLFDSSLHRIKSWSFQTGWRNTITKALLAYYAEIGQNVIVLHTARYINGRNVAKQYFAFGNDRLRVVRIENDRGEAVLNEYVYPNYEIGIVPDSTTVEEWVSLLKSSDKADVLSALVFLGGRHISDPRFADKRKSKYAELFLQLIGDTRIRDLIAELTKSDDDWVRQAAILAARGPDDRLLQ